MTYEGARGKTAEEMQAVFHFLFLFVIIFNISLLILFIFKAYYPLFFDNELYFFTQILGLFILYIFIRYFVGLILGNLFDLFPFLYHVV